MSERLICNDILQSFSDNEVFSPNRSRSKLKDFCINQHTAVTREIRKRFKGGLEARGMFLGISKHLIECILINDTCQHDSKIFSCIHDKLNIQAVIIDFKSKFY